MLIIALGTILLSALLSLLGVISLWKKYIYLADGIAHSSLLIIAAAAILNFSIIYTAILITFIFIGLIFKLKQFSGKNEAILLTSNLSLALALIINSINPMKTNISNLLFGDLLAINTDDLFVILALLMVVIIFIVVYYNKIVLTVLNQDLAKIAGIKVNKIELTFLIILALSIFCSIKIVGALLVTSILLLPAMSARLIAATPASMLCYSIIIALVTSFLGLFGAFYFNTPVAPAIIIIGAVLYGSCGIIKR